MPEWVPFLSGFVWGCFVFGMLLWWKFEVRRKLPFRWECTEAGCYFAVSANYDAATLLEVVEFHKRTEH